MTKLAPHERKDLLIKVLASPPLHPRNQQVDWETLYKENPGLRQKLGATDAPGQARLSVMVANLRAKGLVPRAGRHGDAPTPPPPASNGRGTTIEVEDDALVEQRKATARDIMRGFPLKNGRVPLKDVLTRHPEYKTLFGNSSSMSYYCRTVAKEPEFAHIQKQMIKRGPNKTAQNGKATIEPPQPCILKAPGVEITFSASFLPKVLTTIAFALEGKK